MIIKTEHNNAQEQIIKVKDRNKNSNPMYSIHKVTVSQLHKKRQGNANCKTRSEVRGGGKKPWKQKGTGKARAGSIRSPLWRGGGVVFGPKSKKYSQKINKKEKKLAIKNILQNKRSVTTIIDESVLQFKQPKTRAFLETIKTFEINASEKLLIIMTKKYLNTYLAVRNLKNIKLITAEQVNLLSVIQAKHILIERDAIKTVNTICNE